MVVDGVRTNKKQLVKMHLLQSRFFNEFPMRTGEIRSTSAHELYRMNKRQFERQPAGHKRAFVVYVRTPAGGTWRGRLRYRIQIAAAWLRGLVRGRK